LAAALLGLGSCKQESAQVTLVLYTSVDEPLARPILDRFTKRTGIAVDLQADAEKNKSVGLARRLEAERDHPRADVWWGNEVFHTINLAAGGLLEPYDPPTAKDVPPLFKDPGGLWTGNALRARVIAVGGDGVLPNRSILDLANPRLKHRIAMAHPSAGTTSGHVAALYVLWGPDRARQFFRDLKANGMKLVGGNSVVAEAVGRGTFQAGLTDNDDVAAASREGGKLSLVLPDQDGIGTLTIPTTVALVRGSKHAGEARQLVDFLCSREVEDELIRLQFAAYTVRGGAGASAIVPMKVDYREVAKVLKQASEEAVEILEGRK
jgi:iron(III) transport system substrate-binding protein